VKVVGYIRVSTEDQARECVSLAQQRAKIDAYALVEDWSVVEIIQDDVTTKHLRRPGVQWLIELVEHGHVGAVIVYKLDRLTHSVKDLNSLVELFDKKNVALVSLQESLDATTVSGRLMMNLLASVSQWEREVISERTRDAMQHLKASGKVYSRPVFDDTATLARIHTRRAAGATYQEIADELTASGVLTVRGGRWQVATILGIVRRCPRQVTKEVA
jgi:site-specific DNA recombinase